VNRFFGGGMIFFKFFYSNQICTMLKMQTNTKTSESLEDGRILALHIEEVSCNNHFDGPCQNR
jgi:hypothetical protein